MGLAILLHPQSAQTAPNDSSLSRFDPSELFTSLFESLTHHNQPQAHSAAKFASELPEYTLRAIQSKLEQLRATPQPATIDLVRTIYKEQSEQPSFDLVEALLSIDPSRTSGQRDALTIACLLRSLAHIGTTPSIRLIFPFIYAYQRVFRPEAIRLIKQLGEEAVPALIEATRSPIKYWATLQLDALGKLVPTQAIQMKYMTTQADVLRAYGRIHDMDALGVVVSFIDSDHPQVRQAAREATLKYGADAIWKLREAYTNLIGKSPPDYWSVETLARELFTTCDQFRTREIYPILEEGLAHAKKGDFKKAVARFDLILSKYPLLDRRREMIGTYLRYAQSLQHSDPATAAVYYRRAANLDPSTPEAKQAQSTLVYLEGIALWKKGTIDMSLFEQALELNPAYQGAKKAVSELRSPPPSQHGYIRQLALAGSLFLVALALIISLGGPAFTSHSLPSRPYNSK
ncbi:hypothetical protein [Pajaroellobacter abortibovis]|nr:hypothetical protein [Pajaroellobacter abortibovis]